MSSVRFWPNLQFEWVYIGNTEKEIYEVSEAACWNFALFGAQHGWGNLIDQNKVVPAHRFFSIFSIPTDKEAIKQRIEYGLKNYKQDMTEEGFKNLVNESVEAEYENLKTVEGRLSCIMCDMTENDKKLIKPYKKELQKILDDYYESIKTNQTDYKKMQEEAMKTLIRVNGFEIAAENEKETCPFAITMHTSGKNMIEWEHWGFEIRTSEGSHVFETVPGSVIGHRPMTFEKVHGSKEYNTFSIPIKNPNKAQIKIVNDSLDYFVNKK